MAVHNGAARDVPIDWATHGVAVRHHVCRCGNRWEGLVSTLTLGPRSREPGASRSWWCGGCFRVIHVPRVTERKVWEAWSRGFRTRSRDPGPGVLRLIDRIDTRLADARWYAPTPIALDRVDCPGCGAAMTGDESAVLVVACPSCGGSRRVDTFTSHVSMPPA